MCFSPDDMFSYPPSPENRRKYRTMQIRQLTGSLSLHRVSVSNGRRKFAFAHLKVSKQSWLHQFHLVWRRIQNFTLFVWNPCEWATAWGPRPPFEPQPGQLEPWAPTGGLTWQHSIQLHTACTYLCHALHNTGHRSEMREFISESPWKLKKRQKNTARQLRVEPI